MRHVRKILLCGLFSLAVAPAFSQSDKAVRPALEVGVLTAYYATESYTDGNGMEYKKGQLVCDSNDPLNRIVEADSKNYRYEGDDTGENYSWLIPKSKLKKVTFKMNELSYADVDGNATFVSANGCVARIFFSKINGHSYCNWEGKEENRPATDLLRECYVLSAEIISPYDQQKYLFEEQLEERHGFIGLYRENRYAMGDTDPSNCRYREGRIGFVEETWCNPEDWEEQKSAFDKDGNLLTDQWEVADIADYISVAYIADKKALYIKGELYYRK